MFYATYCLTQSREALMDADKVPRKIGHDHELCYIIQHAETEATVTQIAALTCLVTYLLSFILPKVGFTPVLADQKS